MKKILFGIFAFLMSITLGCGGYFLIENAFPNSSEAAVEMPEYSITYYNKNSWTEWQRLLWRLPEGKVEQIISATYAANSFADGDGTKENPYQISDASQLARMLVICNGIVETEKQTYIRNAYYELTDNINLKTSLNQTELLWEPIEGFSGVFDGKGHTISGMEIELDRPDWGNKNIGLFGQVKGGTIKNFNLQGSIVLSCENYEEGSSSSVIDVYSNIGAVAGMTSSNSKTYFGNIISSVSIAFLYFDYNKSERFNFNVGGIVGGINGETEIVNCFNKGDFFAENCARIIKLNYGGIVGNASKNLNIKNSVNKCRLTFLYMDFTYDDAGYFGGILGKISESSKVQIENCENYGFTYIKFQRRTNVFEGGIVAVCDENGSVTIRGCVNFGDLNPDKYCGGIIAKSSTTGITIIDNCVNYGSIKTASYSGGIAGCLEAFIDTTPNSSNFTCLVNKCINYGEIYNKSNNSAGIVGYLKGTSKSINFNPGPGINVSPGPSQTIVPSIGFPGYTVTFWYGGQISNCVNYYNDQKYIYQLVGENEGYIDNCYIVSSENSLGFACGKDSGYTNYNILSSENLNYLAEFYSNAGNWRNGSLTHDLTNTWHVFEAAELEEALKDQSATHEKWLIVPKQIFFANREGDMIVPLAALKKINLKASVRKGVNENESYLETPEILSSTYCLVLRGKTDSVGFAYVNATGTEDGFSITSLSGYTGEICFESAVGKIFAVEGNHVAGTNAIKVKFSDFEDLNLANFESTEEVKLQFKGSRVEVKVCAILQDAEGKVIDCPTNGFGSATINGENISKEQKTISVFYTGNQLQVSPKVGYAFIGVSSSDSQERSYDLYDNTNPNNNINGVVLGDVENSIASRYCDMFFFFKEIKFSYGFKFDWEENSSGSSISQLSKGETISKSDGKFEYGWSYSIYWGDGNTPSESECNENIKVGETYKNVTEITISYSDILDALNKYEVSTSKKANVVEEIRFLVLRSAISFTVNLHDMMNSHSDLDLYRQNGMENWIEGIRTPLATITSETHNLTFKSFNLGEKGPNEVETTIRFDNLGGGFGYAYSGMVVFESSADKPSTSDVEIENNSLLLKNLLNTYIEKYGTALLNVSAPQIHLFFYYNLCTYNLNLNIEDVSVASTENLKVKLNSDERGNNAVNSVTVSNVGIEVAIHNYTTVDLSTEVLEGRKFVGYYKDDELLSLNPEYSFCINQFNEDGTSKISNLNINAKFASYDLNDEYIAHQQRVYTVSNAQDLIWLSTQVQHGVTFEGYIFRQSRNIDMSRVMLNPIGTEKTPFMGMFDGNNYCIENLKLVGGAYTNNFDNMALFGCTENAIIKNLNLVGGNFGGRNVAGGVVAYAKNTDFKNVNNFSCQISLNDLHFVDIFGKEISENNLEIGKIARFNFGGLVGLAENCRFVGCANNADIKKSMQTTKVSGLVGSTVSSNFDQCLNENNSVVGLANCDENSVITNSYFKNAFSNVNDYTYIRLIDKSNYETAENPSEWNEELWTEIGNKWVLKIFFW